MRWYKSVRASSLNAMSNGNMEFGLHKNGAFDAEDFARRCKTHVNNLPVCILKKWQPYEKCDELDMLSFSTNMTVACFVLLKIFSF